MPLQPLIIVEVLLDVAAVGGSSGSKAFLPGGQAAGLPGSPSL
jgi:hypothetical protein